MIYRRFFKRVLDALVAAFSLLLLSPLMLLTALAIRLEDGGPALFRQMRVGRDGHPFSIFKFRSMAVNAGNLPSAQAGGLPITRVGRLIRRTNIDELPQLLNILKGDMSLVGPRPALPSQEHLTELRRANGALACRPGLTGLAQVESYDGMPEEEKAKHDGAYSARVAFLRDLWLVLRTFAYLAHRPPTY
ncbi:MAG TPA: sugar transferase [Holophagaceae bacterium]|nr:sugar transferase [Holophagaceae bacterium]